MSTRRDSVRSSADRLPTEWDRKRAEIARRFFAACLFQALIEFTIVAMLMSLIELPPPSKTLELPAAFQFGTALLALGSWLLHLATGYVRRENQRAFRRSLLAALAAAVLFVGVQSFGICGFTTAVTGFRDTQTNVHAFVFCFTLLHALHFLIAQSVLLWVTLCAFADRYDHEYHWGVIFASWCWHVLGIVWVAILCVFAIVV